MKALARWFRIGRGRHTQLATLEGAGHVGTLGVQIATDVGNVRSNNEDRAVAVYPHDERMREEHGVMMVLADGMGGHDAGEVASGMAVERVAQLFFGGKGTVLDRLREAFHAANVEIYQAGQGETHQRMGTTCTAVVAVGDTLCIAHVGDSRAYHWREGQLTRLTVDQTYVQYLMQKGTLAYEEAIKHPERNVLMQALGTAATVAPDLSRKAGYAAPGDVIFLCSDGLYEYLSDDEMVTYLNDDTQRGRVAQEMVDEAKRRGGHDNITVLVGQIQPLEKRAVLENTRELTKNREPNP